MKLKQELPFQFENKSKLNTVGAIETGLLIFIEAFISI
jgi:hypothetical protein